MTGGGGDAPPAASGGEFLLSLLQKQHHQHQHQHQTPPQPQASLLSRATPITPPPPPQQQQQQQQQQSLSLDPAVAAVGPTVPFLPPSPWTQSNGRDLPGHPWPHHQHLSSPLPPHFLGLPQNLWIPPGRNQAVFGDDLQRLGFPVTTTTTTTTTTITDVRGNSNSNSNYSVRNPVQQDQKIVFGTLNGSSLDNWQMNAAGNGLDRNRRVSSISNSNPNYGITDSRDQDRRGKHHQIGNYRSTPPPPQPPPGFSSKPRGGNWGFDHNVDKEKGNYSDFSESNRVRTPAGSNLGSASSLDVEDSVMNFHRDDDAQNEDDFGQKLVDSLLLEDESHDKKDKKQLRDKEARSDDRGRRLLSQRMRILKRQMECRIDIDRLNAPFIAIYESLIPAEEEKAKQKQLFTLLERLVTKEWPEARLYLYGSCANSFGVSKSDIDVCFAMKDAEANKSEVLLKLADILQSDNLQNVQALARARVPIVKLMDPVTGISCDICINNVLAVVNTKLLRDYAQIDVRLRQLAFIVKHWAKSRGVNETYRGTLSSYAYVLMCIHFLQQRRPAILPCLQERETTYSVTVDNIECAFYDQVENLRNFGSHNKETIAKLVWAFFNYWAYHHDYANAVISVRTGSILSKREKDWTRRIGNDRHLICIEDPFEVSHDLGRVVDKFSIKVLREEFERAADIMQYSPNPCVTLFEPYVPPSPTY